MLLRPLPRFVSATLLVVAAACSEHVTQPAPHPGSPAAVAAVAGDAQVGRPGAALALPLTVQVADSAGHPLQGVSVAWRAGTDAGTLDVDSVRTGADGRASARWTLGGYIGEWTVTAAVGELPPAVFHGSAGGPIHVRIVTPVAGAVLGETVPVQVEVPHEVDVADVVASVGGADQELSVALGDSAARLRWKTAVFQSGPAGPRTLRVTARDVAGNVARAYLAYVHDVPIQIRVADPLTTILAGQVPVRATCSDDNPGGCRSLEVFARVDGMETRLAQGVDSVSTTWSVAGLAGRAIQLVFRASNAVGATGTVERTYSAAPAGWQLVASVPGYLIDASPERALYVAEPYFEALELRDLRSGREDHLAHESNIGPGIPGWVTADGAIVDFGPPIASKPSGVREIGGSSGDGDGRGTQPLARGRWASWIGRRFRPCVLFRDDVPARALAATPEPLFVDSHDLADDGTIAFSAGTADSAGVANSGNCHWPDAELWVWHPGAAPRQVTSGPGGVVRSPVTDGTVFLYLREVPTPDGLAHRLYFLGPAGEEALTPVLPAVISPAAGTRPAIAARRDYQAMNGWAAFQYPDASGAFHTFVRTPSGEVRAVWPGAPAGTRFVSVGPAGEVLLLSGGALYLSAPPHTSAAPLGTWGGINHVKWIGGTMYMVWMSGFYRYDRP